MIATGSMPNGDYQFKVSLLILQVIPERKALPSLVTHSSFWFDCDTEIRNTAVEGYRSGRSGWIHFDHGSTLVSFC